MFRYATEPQRTGQLLDAMFKLYRTALFSIIGLTLCGAAIVQAPQFLLGMGADRFNFPAFSIIAMVGLVINMIFTLAVVVRMESVALGAKLNMGSAILTGTKKLIPVILMGMLYALIVSAGFLLFLIPGIYLSVSMWLAMPAILFENCGPLAALKRSHQLVKGHWWRTATALSVPGLVMMALYVAVAVAGGIWMAAQAPAGNQQEIVATVGIVFAVFTIFVSALAIPLFFTVTLVVFHDLKLRKEGADLSSRFDQLIPDDAAGTPR